MENKSVATVVTESHVNSFRRTIPTAFAIAPISMLFGVIASRADWSLLEVALISLLGFSGSGQFALLPLANSGAGFLTMLLVTASLNSRYLAIALMSSGRLPRATGKRALMAHMLGDESYATERNHDHTSAVLIIRGTLFATWVLSGMVGALIARFIPANWVGTGMNLGYPASVVLMYLCVTQIRSRMFKELTRVAPSLWATGLCIVTSLALIKLIGPMYFWIPSILIASVILRRTGI